MASPLHQIKVIEELFLFPIHFARFYDRPVLIINEKHDVRQFQRRILADTDSGRDPLFHRGFRGSHKRIAPFVIVILRKVNAPHNAGAHFSAAVRSLHINHRIFIPVKQIVREIPVHGTVNLLQFFFLLRAVQIYFRQNHPQGGRRFADNPFRLFPVFRLAGKLVAGDHRPPGHIGSVFWQQNICRIKCLVHFAFSSLFSPAPAGALRYPTFPPPME